MCFFVRLHFPREYCRDPELDVPSSLFETVPPSFLVFYVLSISTLKWNALRAKAPRICVRRGDSERFIHRCQIFSEICRELSGIVGSSENLFPHERGTDFVTVREPPQSPPAAAAAAFLLPFAVFALVV